MLPVRVRISVAAGAGLDFDAAEAGECAGIEHIARIFMRCGRAQRDELAGVAGADQDVSGIRLNGQAESLLRVEMADVGIAAVVCMRKMRPRLPVSAIRPSGRSARA